MRITRTAVTFVVLITNLLATTSASATLIPNPDGLRVYDTFLKVTWLADADLPATKIAPDNLPFYELLGFQTCDRTHLEPCVDPNGAMGYETAQAWVQALNNYPGGGYLGHHKWTIPRIEATDSNCTIRNWAYNCMNSALGSLYYQSLPSSDSAPGFTYPDTAVPIPHNQVGPFHNFQPYLYWTSSAGHGTGKSNSGETTFSFNTGWQGSNHTFHYMYVLPMIPGQVQRDGIYYIPTGPNDLQLSSDGKMVWDPDAFDENTGATGVTWLADADLPLKEKFGLDHCQSHHRACINADGSMKYTTAKVWLDGMRNYKNDDGTVGWLGRTDWVIPSADPRGGCDLPFLHCTDGPMGELFFKELDHGQGDPVVPTPDINVGPFYHLQPFLYWSCMGPDPCQGPQPPHGDQEWSFSFGNGFQGTDIVKNNLYVMLYYPQTPAEALHEGLKDELADYPQVRNRFFTEADQISSAPTFVSMVFALDLFDADVNSQRGTKLTSVQADYLMALAQAAADATGLQPPQPPPRPCKPHCI